jgi:hypothetical protein|tara:strand:- start:8431 stop:8658 length:228 start_codon:yes stop_codon:yes gene_type:complete
VGYGGFIFNFAFMKNLKEIKTTILGIFFIVAASFYWYETKDSYNVIVLGATYSAGVLLLLAPDALLLIIKRKFKK